MSSYKEYHSDRMSELDLLLTKITTQYKEYINPNRSVYDAALSVIEHLENEINDAAYRAWEEEMGEDLYLNMMWLYNLQSI